MSCWNLRESPLAPASDSEFPPQSTSALLFDEGDPLSQPKGNIAASSVDPTAGECPASPASNFDDMPPDGKLVKGNVKAPPQTPQFTASSDPPPPGGDGPRPYVLICGKRVEVPEAYPKGVEGPLVRW